MKAVVYEGVRQVGVQEVPDPVIEDPADAVVRMTSSAICGTDSTHAIDAVGFQAHDRDNPGTELPTQVINDIVRLVNPTGHVGVAGVYVEKDLHPAPQGAANGAITVPWATLFTKGVSVGFGRTHDRRYTVLLRDPGRARPEESNSVGACESGPRSWRHS